MTPQEEALASMKAAMVTAQDALVLLQTGRAGMAAHRLADLPQLIYDAIQDARAEGRWQAREAGKEQAEREATQARSLGWLQGYGAGLATGTEKGKRAGFAKGARSVSAPPQAVADRERLARLCEQPGGRALATGTLKIRDRDLDAILAGRVQLASTGWKRLWAAVPGK